MPKKKKKKGFGGFSCLQAIRLRNESSASKSSEELIILCTAFAEPSARGRGSISNK